MSKGSEEPVTKTEEPRIISDSETEEQLKEDDKQKGPDEEMNFLKLQLKTIMQNMNMIMEQNKELKDKLKGREEAKEKTKDDGITKLQGINQKDMPKPQAWDMEPNTFLNWNELFVAYLMSIDSQWEKILRKLQLEGKPMTAERIEKIQTDEFKMPKEVREAANHALYINLLNFTSGKAKGRVTSNKSDLSFESYRYIHEKGRNATRMNRILMRSTVLKPTPATKVEEVENRLNEWKEKQRYLEELEEPRLDDLTKKSLLVSILPSSLMEHIIKSVHMKDDGK